MSQTAFCTLVAGTVMVVLGLEVSSLPAQELAAPAVLSSSSPVVFRLTLDEARQRALAHNKLLQLAMMNVGEKQIAISAAKRDYFPKVVGTAFYLHFNDDLGTVLATRGRNLGGQQISIRGTGPVGLGANVRLPSINIPSTTAPVSVINQDTAIGMVMVAQPLTKLIGVSALVDIARADEQIAAAQLDKGTADLLSGVTQAYYGLLAARRVHSALTLQVGMVEPLIKAHPAPELRLGLLEIRKGVLETEKQIAELNDLLNQLVGLPACTDLDLVEPALPPVPVTCAGQAAQMALVNNPQVREAEQSIRKAQAGLRAAKMEYLPDVNVFGAYIAQSAADYVQEDFTAVGLQASYTFFDWGKRRQVKLQRQTQIAMAAQNVQTVIEAVDLDARKAYLAFKQAEQELGIAQETVSVRQDAQKAAKAPAEQLTAASATAKAQLDQMQAELNYRLAHAKLLAIIGQP